MQYKFNEITQSSTHSAILESGEDWWMEQNITIKYKYNTYETKYNLTHLF